MKTEVSAGGIVYQSTPTGVEWLLIQPSHNASWSFPKGLIGDINDESQEEAALREVREEGGVVARSICPLSPPSHYTYYWQGQPIAKTVHYYLMEYVSGSTADHDHEVREARFIPQNEVIALLTYDTDKKQFEVASARYNTIRAPLV